MTIKHTVLLVFKPLLTTEEIEQVRLSLAGLQKSIPEILSFAWVENNSAEDLHRGHLYGFVMKFKNDLDRKIYLKHPEHIRVTREFLFPALLDGVDSLLVFDHIVDD